MKKKPTTKATAERRWTTADLRKFDGIIRRCDSQNQLTRIEGRIDCAAFEKRFTQAEMEEMWAVVKTWGRRQKTA
jgi:hypothetical protein